MLNSVHLLTIQVRAAVDHPGAYAMLQDISKSSGQKFNFQNCLKSTRDCVNIALEGVFMILKTKFYKKSFIFSFVDFALFYEIWPFSLLKTHFRPKNS